MQVMLWRCAVSEDEVGRGGAGLGARLLRPAGSCIPRARRRVERAGAAYGRTSRPDRAYCTTQRALRFALPPAVATVERRRSPRPQQTAVLAGAGRRVKLPRTGAVQDVLR